MSKKIILKEETIQTCKNLINILKEQIQDLKEHPENVFFGTIKASIKGWNDVINKHNRVITKCRI